METAAEARLANILCAVALGLADEMTGAAERAAGLTGAGPASLVLLSQSLRGASMNDLRHAVGLTPSGAVRLVDRLVALGLVERRAGADHRSLALVLTRAGRLSAQRVLAARAQVVTAAMSSLTDAECSALVPVMEQLAAAVTVERLTGARDSASGWLCRLCDHGACGRPDGRCPAAGAAAAAVHS